MISIRLNKIISKHSKIIEIRFNTDRKIEAIMHFLQQCNKSI